MSKTDNKFREKSMYKSIQKRAQCEGGKTTQKKKMNPRNKNKMNEIVIVCSV